MKAKQILGLLTGARDHKTTLKELFREAGEPDQWVLDMISSQDYEVPLPIKNVPDPGNLVSAAQKKPIKSLEKNAKQGETWSTVETYYRQIKRGIFPKTALSDVLLLND